jgi:carbon-monoxide dehydrogenase medium subunit
LGATITHAAIEDRRIPDPTGGFLAKVARGIAYRAVRTRGTIGGSLAHADPSADWLACLTALGAEVMIAGPGGNRRVLVPAFVRGAMETELAPGELLTAVRIPRFPSETRFGFHKICRKTGEFADAIAVVVAIPQHAYLAAAVSPAGGRPQLMEVRKVDWPRAAMTLDEAKAILTAADKVQHQPGDDGHTRALHAVALKRAYEEACPA